MVDFKDKDKYANGVAGNGHFARRIGRAWFEKHCDRRMLKYRIVHVIKQEQTCNVHTVKAHYNTGSCFYLCSCLDCTYWCYEAQGVG